MANGGFDPLALIKNLRAGKTRGLDQSWGKAPGTATARQTGKQRSNWLGGGAKGRARPRSAPAMALTSQIAEERKAPVPGGGPSPGAMIPASPAPQGAPEGASLQAQMDAALASGDWSQWQNLPWDRIAETNQDYYGPGGLQEQAAGAFTGLQAPGVREGWEDIATRTADPWFHQGEGGYLEPGVTATGYEYEAPDYSQALMEDPAGPLSYYASQPDTALIDVNQALTVAGGPVRIEDAAQILAIDPVSASYLDRNSDGMIDEQDQATWQSAKDQLYTDLGYGAQEEPAPEAGGMDQGPPGWFSEYTQAQSAETQALRAELETMRNEMAMGQNQQQQWANVFMALAGSQGRDEEDMYPMGYMPGWS